MVTVAAPGSRFVASLECASHPYPSEKEVIKCSLLVKMKRMLRVAQSCCGCPRREGLRACSCFGTCFTTLPYDKEVIKCSLWLQLVQEEACASLSTATAVAVERASRHAAGPERASPRARTTRKFRSVRFQMLTPSACLLLSTGSFSHAGASSVARLL